MKWNIRYGDSLKDQSYSALLQRFCHLQNASLTQLFQQSGKKNLTWFDSKISKLEALKIYPCEPFSNKTGEPISKRESECKTLLIETEVCYKNKWFPQLLDEREKESFDLNSDDDNPYRIESWPTLTIQKENGNASTNDVLILLLIFARIKCLQVNGFDC